MELKREKNFPRGGRKPALFKSSTSSFSFLKKPKAKLKKKIKKTKQSEPEIVHEKTSQAPKEFIVKYVEDLKPSIIQDEMLILGIVSKITEKIVTVSLPGGLRGAITLSNVSEFYRNIIENCSESSEVPTLKEVFKIGDVLPVKVIAASEKHHSLMLTSDPKSINQKLSYNLLEKNLIFTGSVKSQEDHGFVIDFGLEHVNGFLNYNKVDETQNLKVGQLVRCCIIQCNISHGSCNVQLSILKKDVQSAFINKNSTLPIFSFIPGFQFEVTIEKVLREGVEVSCDRKDFPKGYIYEDHFLKKFSNPNDLKVGTKIIATLMYVKPLVNFLYFKILPKNKLEWPFDFGEIVRGKVAKVRRTGVIFRISDGSRKAKCFVPVSKLQSKLNLQEKSEIFNAYPLNKVVPQIRLGNVDFMGRYYVGATDKASIYEKYYSISDINCGDIVTCKILGFGKSVARLEIGRSIKGIVAFTDMADVPLRNPATKFKIGQNVKARVLEVMYEKLFVRLTMKPTLLKEKEILHDINSCKKNSCYIGSIVKVTVSKIIVKFFNHIFGVIPKHLTPYPDAKSLIDYFYKGQLLKCYPIKVVKKGLHLSLIQTNADVQLVVGQSYSVEVLSVTDGGLFLNVTVEKNTKCTGYLPSALLTQHQSLVPALHSTYSPGEKFSAYCVINNSETETPVFGSEEIFSSFFEGKSEKELKKLFAKDSVLPFLFRNISTKKNIIYLRNFIPGVNNCNVVVVKDDFSGTCPLFKYQLIYGKILSVQKKRVEVSVKVSDVWDKDYNSSLGLLDNYLKTMTTLVLRQKNKLNAYIGNLYLGSPVKGVIEEVKTNHAVVKIESGDLGIAEGKFERGQEVCGKIVWIDGPEQIFYVKKHSSFSADTSIKIRNHDILRGKVVFINKEVVVSELKGRGKGELAFLPRRRHLNDVMNNECVIVMEENLKLWITRKNSNYLLAMDYRIVSLQEKIIWKKSESKLKESVQSLKRKLESEKIERLKKRKNNSVSDDIEVLNVKLSDKSNKGNVEGYDTELPEVKEEKDLDNEKFTCAESGVFQLEFDNVDIKSEADTNENEYQKPVGSTQNNERIELSSSSESEDDNIEGPKIEDSKVFNVGFNWEVLNNNSLLSGVLLNKDISSEDEDEDSKYEKKKRRRLSAIEKKEKAKNEEERLRLIEERLMDPEREPETADDFDRAVLSNPNSSALWLKYMAFHIQGTEIEKARAVARRALKAISFREEQEKLNIWIALLNLENLYGNEESLKKTLGEALQVNEPYRIHLHLLNIHGQSNRLQDMEKLGNFMLKKYKDIGNVWCDVALAYFSVGKVESARNVLQKALAVVEKNLHVPLISKFAQLENKYGSPERAQTLYESILASFPKRVDIWCCYVDMLIKSNHIELARQVLERAISQSLRPRKMKTLFKKFISFEESHGNAETVEKVRAAAVEYVQSAGSLED